jgi:hypothetical protein
MSDSLMQVSCSAATWSAGPWSVDKARIVSGVDDPLLYRRNMDEWRDGIACVGRQPWAL